MIRGNKKKNKPKFKRKEKQNKLKFKRKTNNETIITKPMGGFLPYPPNDCPKKAFFIKSYGVIWLDLSICHNCVTIKDCDNRKKHLYQLKEKRREYFNGKDEK